jgi:hypothetical protein
MHFKCRRFAQLYGRFIDLTKQNTHKFRCDYHGVTRIELWGSTCIHGNGHLGLHRVEIENVMIGRRDQLTCAMFAPLFRLATSVTSPHAAESDGSSADQGTPRFLSPYSYNTHFNIILPFTYSRISHLDHQIKNQMGGSCSTHGNEEKCIHSFGWKT